MANRNAAGQQMRIGRRRRAKSAGASSRRGMAVFWLAAVIGAALLPGCASQPSVIPQGPVYPTTRRQTRSLDIQVFRSATVIRVTNTTAHSYPACRMWLNSWFSREIGPLGVGQTIELRLSSFRDRYGEAFRAGGFFAAEKPTLLVLAQLELESELVGLIVVGGED
jgi:hypothetical protein